MTEKRNYAAIQAQIDRQQYQSALRSAGPCLEAHPDNLPAWYQVATAAAHLKPGATAIKNLESAVSALVRGRYPLQSIVSLQDSLLPGNVKSELLKELIAGYSVDSRANADTPRLLPRTFLSDPSPWSELLSVDELCQMADSLCAVAWGNSLETLQKTAAEGDVPLFSSVGSKSFEALVESAVIGHAAQGDNLVSRGTRSDVLQIIVYGTAFGEMHIGHGQRAQITFGENDIIGEESLLTGNDETIDIIAAAPCTLLLFPVEMLTQIAESEAAVAKDLVSVYQQRILRALLQKNPLLATIPVDERVTVLRQMQPIIVKSMAPVLLDAAPKAVEDVGALMVLSGSIVEEHNTGAYYQRGDWIDIQKWKSTFSETEMLMARENTVSLKLSSSAFHAIIATYPQLIEAMYPLQK